jgi:heavy metal sensor kinase
MSSPPSAAIPQRLLRRYLLGWTLGVLFVVWLALIGQAWYTAFHEARKFSDGQLVAVAKLWLTAAPSGTTRPVPVSLPGLAHEYLQDVAVMAWENGQLVTDTHGMAAGLDLSVLPSQGFVTVNVVANDLAPSWRSYSVQAGQGAELRRVVVLMDMRQRFELGKDIAEHVAQPAVLILPLVALLLWWAIRRGLRPLDRLSSEVAALDGFAGQRLDPQHRYREFASTVAAINALVDTLQTRAQREREFASDVAHELRTPLANLIGHTEVALSRERSVPELEETLHSNLEELHRMAAIVNDMLFLAQADRGVKARRGAPVSLAELVHQVVEFHEAPMEERGLSVTVEGDARLPVDEPLVKRALSNLLGNAIRYADQGSPLRVRIAQESGSGVRLWVENTGPSIEPEHLPRLFDRFFRADAARCELEKPHHGLGLSIVAAIARMHDGFPAAESSGGTTRVGFSLHSSPAV